MKDNEEIAITHFALTPAIGELRECNSCSSRYGLTLTDKELIALVNKRRAALADTGRVEFCEGILKKLILSFCDSPYIMQEDWEETLAELQDCFYYFKKESHDTLTDDELILAMKDAFDGECEGSVAFLEGSVLEALCHGRGKNDELNEENYFGYARREDDDE